MFTELGPDSNQYFGACVLRYVGVWGVGGKGGGRVILNTIQNTIHSFHAEVFEVFYSVILVEVFEVFYSGILSGVFC